MLCHISNALELKFVLISELSSLNPHGNLNIIRLNSYITSGRKCQSSLIFTSTLAQLVRGKDGEKDLAYNSIHDLTKHTPPLLHNITIRLF